MFLLRVIFAIAVVSFLFTLWRMFLGSGRGLSLQFPPASISRLGVTTTAEVVLLSPKRTKSCLIGETVSGARAFREDEEIIGKDLETSTQPYESSGLRAYHVLMVGSMELGNVVRSTLLGEPNLTISIVTNYRELWTIPNQEIIHLVILNATLSTLELEASSRLVRQRWPRAKILVVRQGEGFLEDALYDDRVTAGDTPEVLRGRIGRLLISHFDRSRQNAR